MHKLLLLFFLVGCPSSWTYRDSIRETTLVGITAVDWYQTIGITKRCDEFNPIIGECGERVNMHLYFLSVLILQGVFVRVMPEDWRAFSQGMWIGIESAVVHSNYRLK